MSQDRVRISNGLAAWLKRSKSLRAQVAVERNFSQVNPEPDTATNEPEIFNNPADGGHGAVDEPAYETDLGVTIAASDPVLWARLNETGNDPVREVHRSDPFLASGSPIRSGVVSQGFAFDGVDDSVYLASTETDDIPVGLLNTAGVFSVEALVLPAYATVEGISHITRWGIDGMELRTYRFVGIDQTGYLTCIFYDESSVAHTVEAYFTDWDPGTQRHVAATYDGTELKLFIDGTEVDSELTTAAPNWGVGGWGIAVNGPSESSYWKGSIAEVAIYDRAMSDAEVLDHATQTRTATNNTFVTVTPW